MRLGRAISVIFALCACATDPEPTAPVTDTATLLTTETASSPTHGGDTADTAGTTSPWLETVDCSGLLPLPLQTIQHTWVPSHEDFTFDDQGYLYGVESGLLKRTPFGGPSELIMPGIGNVRGTRFLADGALMMARMDDNAVIRLDPNGGLTVVATLDNPNGIAIGVDGMAYVASFGRVVRVDPYQSTMTVIADMPNHSFDGLTFSPDYSRLYVNEEIGNLWVIDDPMGSPSAAVAGPTLPIGFMSILDGMTMDACGNLYAVEMGGVVWRVSPTGEVAKAMEITDAGAFVPALNFGSGVGGWDANTLYVNDFLGRIYEAEVGVPGKYEPHL